MSAEPLELEKVYSLGTTPLWDLLRDDSGCNDALSSLLDDSEVHAESHREGRAASAPQEMLHLPSGEVTEDSSVSTAGLEIPAQVQSSRVFSNASSSAFSNETSRKDKPTGRTLDTLSVVPEVSVSGGGMSAQNTEPQAIVSFPLSEVRQNAFFFVVSRGGMIMEQPGNKRLRRIINMHAQVYIHARRVDRGALKRQVFELCQWQFEFVIQKQAFMRSYDRHLQQNGGRHLSRDRIRSILEANGGAHPIMCCKDTDFVRVGDECAFDVVGHLLRDAANELRRSQRDGEKKKK